MITFVPLARPDSTGRGPACAIRSHDRIALITSADPPTMPKRSRKPRLVRGKLPPFCEVFSVMAPPERFEDEFDFEDLPPQPNLELHRTRVPAHRRQLSERRRAE